MKRLGIIRHVTFGLRDCGRPVLAFDVAHYPCTGSLQIVELDGLKDFLTKDADGKSIYIKNIEDLVGHPIIMESTSEHGGGYSTIVGLWKP